jgi:hypothetical protein
MLNRMPLKLAAAAILVAAATISGLGTRDELAVGLLAFGLFNAVVSPAGTIWVRAVAVLATLAALVFPGSRVLVTLVAWLVWPPAIMVAWAIARERHDRQDAEPVEQTLNALPAKIAVTAIIVAVALAAVWYRVVVAGGLQQTAALFVGIPALLAVVVVFGVTPRTSVGVACKAVTIGLLVSLLFLGEGILCIAMSAPLFYGVAVGIAGLLGRMRSSPRRPQRIYYCMAVLAVLPLSFEGVTEYTSIERQEQVSETRVLDVPSHAVARAVLEPPRFDRALPLYLRLGFPRPEATRIEQGPGKPRWVIRFRGGEMRLDGIEPRAGDLIVELDELRPGFARWRAVSDDSHMTHFLEWRGVDVAWEAVGEGKTKVTWTVRYRRGLDPAWYFGPWERYAARLAAGYLIDAVATP